MISIAYEHPSISAEWKRCALLKDRTRRFIRERLIAGESVASLAADFSLPEEFVTFLGAWQMFGDEPQYQPVIMCGCQTWLTCEHPWPQILRNANENVVRPPSGASPSSPPAEPRG